ncbi:MAG TPA: amidohydrolase family protein [Tepidisphaeraceae bacterium]|jgi:imidazolonepropionase-like amidohydrolase|nr:amidohydrolase family protein [Tepidisphaeraceae bacterium]
MTDFQTLEHLALQSKERPVWLRVGQLIDGDSDQPIRNAHVVFDARQIYHAGGRLPDSQILKPDQREPDLDLPDATLLPCLIEAHAHAFLEGGEIDFGEREQYLKQPPATFLERAKARTTKILQCGIGAIRDAGDKHGVGLALAAEAKHYVGKLSSAPYIDSPGPAIHHKGRYGAFMGQPIEEHASPAACVAARVAAGADRIKLLVSGIINFKEGRVTTPPQMPIEEVKAIVEAARSYGRQTFAHASGAKGVEHSIEGGVNTVEHGFFITEDQLAKMRDRNIAWVPTFAPVQLQIDRAKDLGWDDVVVGHLKRIIESHQRMLRRAHEMGVKIVAGSDAGSCGVPHGIGFLQELEQMERAGLPAMAVLKSATSRSADVLAFPDKIGRIAPGHRSRMLLTRNDPARTITALFGEKAVLFDGQAVHCPASLSTSGL